MGKEKKFLFLNDITKQNDLFEQIFTEYLGIVTSPILYKSFKEQK